MSNKLKVLPDKACYRVADEVFLIIGLDDFSEGPTGGYQCTTRLFHLDSLIHTQNEYFRVEEHGQSFIMRIFVPREFRAPGLGFGVELNVQGPAGEKQQAATAFDFDDPENRVIRYGFLCDFTGPGLSSSESSGVNESVDFLTRCHITHVQYYDWVPAHHEYRSGTRRYRDAMGKQIDLDVVQQLIQECRRRGIRSIGYGAVYAAGKEFLAAHPDWGLYDCDGKPFDLIDKFFIMNIEPGSPWNSHIIEQYRYAVEDVGFDGLHMDSYGFPKKGFVYPAAGSDGAAEGPNPYPVFLEEGFRALIEQTRESSPQAELIFNNVGNWPVEVTATAPQDVVYIEVWSPHVRYHHIRSIVISAKRHSKPVVIAAYVAPFRTERDANAQAGICATVFLHAALYSLGASHLLVGENAAVLTQGYYNDYSLLSAEEADTIVRLYDYVVRYRELFFDNELVDISETHTAGENREYAFGEAPVSIDGEAGTIWTIVREKPGRKVIHLINLLDQSDDLWNKGKRPATPSGPISVVFPMDGTVKEVFYCSPFELNGRTQALDWAVTEERGPAGQVQL